MAKSFQTSIIYLAGGCFWGLQRYLERVPGVVSTTVGYAQGEGHERPAGGAECVRVEYDPDALPLEVLLELLYWVIDPTAQDHQGNDRGPAYRTGIYWETGAGGAEAAQTVTSSLTALQERYDHPVMVEAAPLANFEPADDWHQDYLQKNPSGYCHIPLAKIAQASDKAERLRRDMRDF
ncbi:MAG: peptide-methionine (S)-S-oxide reductase MsrA [Coriobacteriales bacterium]|jgi:peptide methionine sulfoxide reductase msrA/msrB|nr:peptide-methionine (S)-S-oxide reductase MsrA [Coriobacteriales bacterium]